VLVAVEAPQWWRAATVLVLLGQGATQPLELPINIHGLALLHRFKYLCEQFLHEARCFIGGEQQSLLLRLTYPLLICKLLQPFDELLHLNDISKPSKKHTLNKSTVACTLRR